ncbi:MAG: chemotaxis protein CheW [Leptospiraceae bacterium]|nr:chemotaxis protein CheW [Leptospiraceae bacterium]MCP5510347.1 chemotaxis protein CheW [Leptospiraceae bacterium]
MEKDRTVFLSESYETLNALDSELIELRKNPESNEILNSIHAHYQTFLESSKINRFLKLESLIHIAERLISHLLQVNHEVSNEMTTTILKLNMSIREVLFSIDDTGKEPAHLNESIIADVEEVIKKTEDEGFMDEMGNATDLLLAGTPPTGQNTHADLLNRFMDIVVELHHSKEIFTRFQSEFKSLKYLQESTRLNNLITELYDEVREARSQPLGTLIMNFDKLIKDTIEPLGKSVVLRVQGKEKEIDSELLENLKLTIIQLIKNSLEHGIETIEERKELGKAPDGQIHIDAYYKGEYFHTVISDDGRGMDPEKVRRKLIEKNVMLTEEASEVSDEEILHYLFRDGYAGLNETGGFVGGKPSGMDLAKIKIEESGGKIYLDKSVKGKGTHIHLQIPLINSIIPVVSANFGTERYAIPKVYLSEILHLTSESLLGFLEIDHGYTFFLKDGKRVPLLYMKQLLKYEDPITDKLPDNPPVELILLEDENILFAIVTDRVTDMEEAILRPLGSQLSDIFLFSGVTILNDGKPALIFNVNEIYRHYLGNPIVKRLMRREEIPPEPQREVEIIENDIDPPLLEEVLK